MNKLKRAQVKVSVFGCCCCFGLKEAAFFRLVSRNIPTSHT